MELNLSLIAILLLIISVVAILARRFKLPYSVGLVLAGIVLGFLPWSSGISLTKELIFYVLLPPLIFEAAFALCWRELKTNLPVILVLATIGVLLSTAITTFGMTLLASWELPSALLFGSLISATDPVSVIATFKEARVGGRLKLLVEAESLFNDGTAAVVFGVALLVATQQMPTMPEMVQGLLTTVLGGIAIGAGVAGSLLLLAGQTEDHLVEISFTSVAAYGAFMLAEHFHCSGVLATLTAGIMLGNIGSLGAITDRGREAVTSFWEYVAFVANALIFLLIGIREVHQDFSQLVLPVLIAIVLVLLGRAMAIYPLSALFMKSRLKVAGQHQHILFWGGLRGALSLALALGLPEGLAHREEIISVAFGVVAFSVFVQGLTITPLLKRQTA